MEKIFVTSSNLVNRLSDYLRAHNISGEVYGLEVDCAAFITPEILMREINSKKEIFKDKLIIVPGNCIGDFSKIQNCVKGTSNIADIELIDDFNILSPKFPADYMIKEKLKIKAQNDLNSENEDFLFKIGNLKIGGNQPVRILAEIVDAVNLTDDEILDKAEYFIKSGADLIDIGMPFNFTEEYNLRIPHIIEILSNFKVPLSIDSLNKKYLNTAIDCGIDLVLSLDASNYEIAKNKNLKNAVVVPKGIKGVSRKKVKFMLKLIEKIKKISDANLFADLILEPFNFSEMKFVESILDYKKFAEKSKTPIFFGAGNVTELIDADSVGVNAVLMGIAYELNASIVFTPEYSMKTRNSVKELKRASEMFYLARKRKTIPKDLGIDLLVLKDKRKYEVEYLYDKEISALKIGFEKDKINFRIFLKNNEIYAVAEKENMEKTAVHGTSAEMIYKTIIKNFGKDIKKEHAAYLGKELEKAEIALKIGKNYIQDADLF